MKSLMFSSPHRLQQDPSLAPSENSTNSSSQEHRHHAHMLPSSPRHMGSPGASDYSEDTEHRETGASTPDISVSSDSEFESWEASEMLSKTFEPPVSADTPESETRGHEMHLKTHPGPWTWLLCKLWYSWAQVSVVNK